MSGSPLDQVAEINGVALDQAGGMGAVPYNQNIGYLGLVVMMKPSMFLAAALPVSSAKSSLAPLREAVRSGAPIASPFLTVELRTEANMDKYHPEDMVHEEGDLDIPPEVRGHEGRHRMMAILEEKGDVEVPVHIFPLVIRARHVTDEMVERLRRGMVREGGRETVTGPTFGDAYVRGRHLVADDEPTASFSR